MSIRLSREEAWAFLADAHTGIFTTLRKDGVPISLPVWFVALDERIYVASPAHRKKVTRVRNDPRASFLVESGERWVDLIGVHLTGHVNIVEDSERIAQVRALLDAKYGKLRSKRSAMPEETRSQYETAIVVMELVPDERILSFDNARVELAPVSDEDLRIITDDGICTITIDRPEARNALSLAMRRRLKELFAEVAADDDVAIVVLTGVDPAFCAGVDTKELAAGAAAEPSGVVTDPAAALRAVPKPVIGAINGVCVTGGLEPALGCDVLLASERARFADTHVKLGLVPAWGMSAFLAHAVGTRKAIELSLTGAFIEAPEAMRCGLVNQVVAHDDLMPRTYEMAAAMRDADPLAANVVLGLYRRAAGGPVEDALALERKAFATWRASRRLH